MFGNLIEMAGQGSGIEFSELVEFLKGQPTRPSKAIIVVDGQTLDGDFRTQNQLLLGFTAFGNGTQAPALASCLNRFTHSSIGYRQELNLAFRDQALEQLVGGASKVHPHRVGPNENMVGLKH